MNTRSVFLLIAVWHFLAIPFNYSHVPSISVSSAVTLYGSPLSSMRPINSAMSPLIESLPCERNYGEFHQHALPPKKF